MALFKASIKGAACQLTHLLSKVSQASRPMNSHLQLARDPSVLVASEGVRWFMVVAQFLKIFS